jgi:hypothetical protein
MTEVIVDTEKLAYGLEQGIGHSNTIWRSAPEADRLRLAPCGLVSSAIHNYLVEQDIASRQIIVRPNLSFDPEMEHVLPLIGEKDQDPLVVDASYSQFLGYVGLCLGYERAVGTKFFPDEKILSFNLSEKDMAINWLTKTAYEFRRINTHPRGEFSLDVGRGPLARASEKRIRQGYAQIYNPANFSPHTPPDRVIEDGNTVAKYIPQDTITVL